MGYNFAEIGLEQVTSLEDGCLLFDNVSTLYNGMPDKPDLSDTVFFEDPALILLGRLRNPLYRTGEEIGGDAAEQYPTVKFVSSCLYRVFSEPEQGFGFVFDEYEMAMGGSSNVWIPVGEPFPTVPVWAVGEINILHGGFSFSRTLTAPAAYGKPTHSSEVDQRRRTDVREYL